MKLLNVVGARPNFMKMAPLVDCLRRRGVDQCLIHTGQHYDANMSKVFFDDLGMPQPDVYLGVGSGSHAEQTAAVMVAFEKVCLEQRPDLIVVVGDVNSTLACSLVGAKLGIPVAHVEAGLRSFDREMPEEINRIVTDRLADLLLTPSPDGDRNLLAEGAAPDSIHRVGNIMIDSLVRHLPAARKSDVLDRLGLESDRFAVLTLHRPSNVDDPETLRGILGALTEISASLPVVFACHPRTAARIDALPDGAELMGRGDIRRIDPLGYLDFVGLYTRSRLVLTDSGGLQEETTYLGIPCVTLRHNTERPITIDEGTNVLAGNDPAKILAAAEAGLRMEQSSYEPPALWDGATADRIVDVFEHWFAARSAATVQPAG